MHFMQLLLLDTMELKLFNNISNILIIDHMLIIHN